MGSNKTDLLALVSKPRKNDLLAKMAKVPAGYTHVGISNVSDLGLTVVIAHEDYYRPLIWHPAQKKWVPLLERSEGGLLT